MSVRFFSIIHDAYFSKTGLKLSINHATREAIEQIQAFWSTSRFYCTESNVILRVMHSPIGYQVRGVPVFFEQGETDTDKYQDLVLDFTSEGKISDVYIAIPQHQVDEILKGNSVTDLRRRQLVLKFFENFQTAYFRKDIAFIEKVFNSDVRIIIRGYDERSHLEYLSKIRKAFQRNEYFNVKLSEIKVEQHPNQRNEHIYGVTLRQDWSSTTYSDSGWLFLMIDFSNEDKPIIWVATWQPISVPRVQVYWFDDFLI